MGLKLFWQNVDNGMHSRQNRFPVHLTEPHSNDLCCVWQFWCEDPQWEQKCQVICTIFEGLFHFVLCMRFGSLWEILNIFFLVGAFSPLTQMKPWLCTPWTSGLSVCIYKQSEQDNWFAGVSFGNLYPNSQLFVGYRNFNLKTLHHAIRQASVTSTYPGLITDSLHERNWSRKCLEQALQQRRHMPQGSLRWQHDQISASTRG